MATVFDILKETRKDNCGKCGFPTCLAFAAAVHSGGAAKSLCPFIESAEEPETTVEGPRTDPETALARQLRSKVKDLDLSKRAPGLGGQVVDIGGKKALELHYLGARVFISAEEVFSESGQELETRDQILLYNYLFFGGHGPLSGKWTGLESFPNSISKVVTLKKYTEDKLAQAFRSRPAGLVEACEKIGGKKAEPCYADACITVPVLPRVPIQIHFWDEDREDGFPAKVKVLFDERALDFLDIESLIFASERLAETLTGQ
jgi:hypothetical protein